MASKTVSNRYCANGQTNKGNLDLIKIKRCNKKNRTQESTPVLIQKVINDQSSFRNSFDYEGYSKYEEITRNSIKEKIDKIRNKSNGAKNMSKLVFNENYKQMQVLEGF